MAREKAPLPNAAPADDKKRAIDTAMAQIERMYGKGAIMRFGDKAELNVDYIPTGSLSLDVAWASAACPRGGLWRSTGRSPPARPPWLCTSSRRPEAGRRGGLCGRRARTGPTYARALGVQVEDMLIAQPDTGEQRWRSPSPGPLRRH